MMQAADLRDGDDSSDPRWYDRARIRRILVERKMGAVAMLSYGVATPDDAHTDADVFESFQLLPTVRISTIFKHRGQSLKDGAQHFDIHRAGGHFAQLHYLVGPPVLVASAPEIDPTVCPKDCEFEIVASARGRT